MLRPGKYVILVYLYFFMSTSGDCFIGGKAGDPKSSADEDWVHLEELGAEYICLHSYQEATESFLWFNWEQSGLFSIIRCIVSAHRAEGQAGAKQFFMVQSCCPAQPASILHDQGRLPFHSPVIC